MSLIPINLLVATTLAETLAGADTTILVVVAVCVVGGIFALLYRNLHGRAGQGEAATTATSSGISPHLVPILAAAAAVAIGRRVVVRRITFINRNTVSGWAEAGRTSIQMSHNLRRTL